MASLITLNNFNLGGIADSEFQGTANSLKNIVGLDIHSEPGIIKPNQALKKVFTPESLVTSIVTASSGKVYLFDETGNVYDRENYTKIYSANAKILDAKEFDGYIYFATQDNLWRTKTGTWKAEKFATFKNKDADYHPMYELNLVLYIGDGNLIAQVEDNIFTADALDLSKGCRVTALGQFEYDLAIGTTRNTNDCKLYRWNTWSASWTVDDNVPEKKINAFLHMDNYTLVSAGDQGNLYVYDGQRLARHKKIPGNYRGKSATVYKNASCVFNGLPMFGFSNIKGNPALQGVYSYGGYASNYPNVLNLEYIPSNGYTEDMTIGALASVGDTLIVSWKRGNEYGIDEIDEDNVYDGAFIETRAIMLERDNFQSSEALVAYRKFSDNSKIEIWQKNNNEAYRKLETTNDQKRGIIYTKTHLKAGTKSKFIVKISGDTEVESLNLKLM